MKRGFVLALLVACGDDPSVETPTTAHVVLEGVLGDRFDICVDRSDADIGRDLRIRNDGQSAIDFRLEIDELIGSGILQPRESTVIRIGLPPPERGDSRVARFAAYAPSSSRTALGALLQQDTFAIFAAVDQRMISRARSGGMAFAQRPTVISVSNPTRFKFSGLLRVDGDDFRFPGDRAVIDFLLEPHSSKTIDVPIRKSARADGGRSITANVTIDGLECSATLPAAPSIPIEGRTGDVALVVATSSGHTCASTKANRIYCWGDNDSGQLGGAPGGAAPEPQLVPNITNGASALCVGRAHTCAIIGGKVVCWGASSEGQAGERIAVREPSFVAGLDGVTSLACAGDTTCAVANGSLICFGKDIVTGGARTPTSMFAELTDLKSVALGAEHGCLLHTSGRVSCWGRGDRLGTGTATSSATPVDVVGVSSVVEIAAGVAHTCAYQTGTAVETMVACWGDRSHGQMGSMSPPALEDGKLPIKQKQVSLPKHIMAGGYRTCARVEKSINDLQCWGSGAPFNTDATAISLSIDRVCAIKKSGGLGCTGDNGNSPLGALPPSLQSNVVGFPGND